VEFDLTDSQHELFDGFVRLAREHVTAPNGDAGGSPRARWEVVCAASAARLAAPGRASINIDLILAMQALGYAGADAPMVLALSCHLLGGMLPLSRWGTAEQQADFLPRLISGEAYAARALPGSMAADTTEGGFRLSGATVIASAGLKPDVAIVLARLSESAAPSSRAFLVPLTGAGGIVWERSRHALGCADTLQLDQVMVPDNRVVGGNVDGDALLTELLPREQLALQATRLGLLQKLLESALRAARQYTRRLKLKGVLPHHYQMLGHKLADFQIRFDAAELMVRRAAWQLDRHGAAAAADVALAGLAIDSGLLPSAFAVTRLQRDYGFDADQTWSGWLADAVEYGRYLCDPARMRATVIESLRAGIA
jgi:alkylation response protein AidB-like acyl-CoA dehydrogenase